MPLLNAHFENVPDVVGPLCFGGHGGQAEWLNLSFFLVNNNHNRNNSDNDDDPT